MHRAIVSEGIESLRIPVDYLPVAQSNSLEHFEKKIHRLETHIHTPITFLKIKHNFLHISDRVD